MPLPHWVARLNKRFTNRFIQPISSRFRWYALIAHRGRITGEDYRTPVFVFWDRATGYVALTYGTSADWVRNVLARGGHCESRRNVTEMHGPRIVPREAAWRCLPPLIRFFLRLLRVEHFLEFTTDRDAP